MSWLFSECTKDNNVEYTEIQLDIDIYQNYQECVHMDICNIVNVFTDNKQLQEQLKQDLPRMIVTVNNINVYYNWQLAQVIKKDFQPLATQAVTALMLQEFYQSIYGLEMQKQHYFVAELPNKKLHSHFINFDTSANMVIHTKTLCIACIDKTHGQLRVIKQLSLQSIVDIVNMLATLYIYVNIYKDSTLRA